MNIACLAVLISLAAVASPSKEYEKKITREFDVNANVVVDIENRYGDVELHTWDQSKVKIDVLITIDARNQDKADEVMDRIKISFNDSGARVKAQTVISTIKNWKRWFGSNSDKFQIDYDVYLPAELQIDIKNKYGDVYVPAMSNRVDVTLKYGNIRIDAIDGDVTLSLGYSKGNLESAKDVDLHMSYSTLRCGDLGDVSIDSKYGRFEANSVKNLRSNSSYDDYKIGYAESVDNSGKYDDLIFGTVGTLDIDSKFTDVEVDILEHEAKLTMKYGGAKLHHVNPGFIRIDVNSSYTSVKIDVDESANFVFEAYTKYCSVRTSGLEIYYDQRKSSETTIKGYNGSRDAQARIIANMSYGRLTID